DRKGEARALEALGVARGDLAAPVGPLRDVPELHGEHRRVEVVQAAVEAEAVDRADGGPVVAHLAAVGVDVLAVGDDGAAVAERAEVLLDDEAGGDGVRQLALLPAGAVAVDALRVVLDDPELLLLRDRA